MSEEVAKHGGSRVGSGRKKQATKKQAYSLKLDSDLIQKLKLIPKIEIEKTLNELVTRINQV